jgi:hypothetical protein
MVSMNSNAISGELRTLDFRYYTCYTRYNLRALVPKKNVARTLKGFMTNLGCTFGTNHNISCINGVAHMELDALTQPRDLLFSYSHLVS